MTAARASTTSGWVVVGQSPVSRFLLERWRLRPDFPLGAVCLNGHSLHDGLPGDLPRLPDIQAILADDRWTGLIVLTPVETRFGLIRQALTAGRSVLVEGLPCATAWQARELQQLSQAAGRIVGVFQQRRAEADDLATLAAVTSGRLGTVHSIRWSSSEFVGWNPPRDGLATLWRNGPWLLHNLLRIKPEFPARVQAWWQTETAGFQLRLEYSTGCTARLELHQASLAGQQTGWIVEGSQAAYRGCRLFSLAGDGEILEEEVPIPTNPDDIMQDLQGLLASPGDAASTSLQRSCQTLAILAGAQHSAQTGTACELSPAAG